MTSSERGAGFRKNIPSPQGDKNDKGNNAYTRFIPREELGGFAAWQPGSLGGGPPPQQNVQRPPEEPPPPQGDPAELIAVQLRAARQGGYQDGYRDGLVALDAFKQAFASQATAQIGALLTALDARLDDLQQEMARALAVAATQLARQIVRGELTAQPGLVARVADEAVEALLVSARHVTLRVHPDDHPLVAEGAADVLEARGARLVDDPAIHRGGVLIDSDIGVVDATVETRWLRATASVGCDAPWDTDLAGAA